MYNKESYNTLINNYISIIQLFFNLFLLTILIWSLKPEYNVYFTLSGDNPTMPLFLVAFLATFLFLILIILNIQKNINRMLMSLALIAFNIIFIVLVYLTTNFDSAKFLFLIPLLIAAIQFSQGLNILIITIVSVIILFIDDLFKIARDNNNIDDLVVVSIFIAIAWLTRDLLEKETISRESLIASHLELIQQRKLLEQLVNQFPLATMVVTPQDEIIFINEAALEDLQLTEYKTMAIGRKFRELLNKKVVFEKHIDFKKLLNSGDISLIERAVIGSKLFEFQIFPIYDENNKIIFITVIFMDITENELSKERSYQIEQSSLVGEMAAGIAHEIKNPLTSIKGFLQLAKIQKDYLTKEHVSLLISEIDRCFSIVSHFLSVTNKDEGEKELVNLKDIIEKHAILIEKDTLLKGIDFKMYLEDVPELFLDSNQIKQLLLNLSRNSIEAISGQGTITIRLINNQDYVLLEIEDTGKGIPEDILEKLGTPFMTTKEKGTGLGFNVCKQIAEAHQALIEVDSQVGTGTKITIAFPRKDKIA